MNDTNKSLLVAVLACISMALFAKSPQFAPGQPWVSGVLVCATFGLSIWGFVLGIRGTKRQRRAWSWFAPGINALVFLTFAAFLFMLFQALRKFQ